MKYYLLRLSSDPKIIGVKNGIAQGEILGNNFIDNKIYQKIIDFFQNPDYWSNNNFIPDFHPNFEYIKVLKGAILTDFFSFTPFLMACPFIISQRVVDLFQDFSIQTYYLFPTKLFQGKEIIDSYKMFYSPLLDYDIVDYSKSVFFTGTTLLGKNRHIFNNKFEYLKFLSANPLTYAEKLVLSKSFNKKLDFFMGRIGEIYISDKLKISIENKNLTGINILEPKEPIIES